MDIDILVFPTPDSSYTWQNIYGELLYIPRFQNSDIEIESNRNNIETEKEKDKESKKEIELLVMNENNDVKKSVNIVKEKSNDVDKDIVIDNNKFENNIDENPYNNNNNTNFQSNTKSKELQEIEEELISDMLNDDFYIPITNSNASHIPCLFLKGNSNFNHSSKFALFFHGNAEDINLSYDILNHIRFSLNLNVIAPEYPGYGIYPGRPSQEGIFEDTLIVYDFLTKTIKVPPQNIVIFGRSIGTSPSTFLASRKQVAGLILISPMLSIKNVAKDILGKLVSVFIKDRFENYKMIVHVECPILIIHGQNDGLISYSHSSELYNLSKAPCELILPEYMDHNEFDFYQEFSEPLLEFMSRNSIFAYTKPCDGDIPQKYFIAPESFKVPFTQWNFLTKLLKKFSIT